MADNGDECSETEMLDEKPRSLLLEIISQLRIGMDLSKVPLPTFILEPRSLLEKLTDFLTHSDLLVRVPDLETPLERMIQIVKWYLSGWHIRPKGVKKPYNPILGEVFRCKYVHGAADGVTTFAAEQVSHHPPVSAFYVENRKKRMVFNGCIFPRSKFLGNSAGSLMEGESCLRLLSHNEEYLMNWPNYYARGIIIGTLLMEMGGQTYIKCKQSGLRVDIDFKTKGYFGGEYNRVKASIIRDATGEELYSVDGHWDSVLTITDMQTGVTEVLFDPSKAPTITPKIVPPESEQQEYESRRLWRQVTDALKRNDQEKATAGKTVLEDEQRRQAKERHELKKKPVHRLFHVDENGLWQYNYMRFDSYDPSEDATIDTIALPPPPVPGVGVAHIKAVLPEEEVGPDGHKAENGVTDEHAEEFMRQPPPHEVAISAEDVAPVAAEAAANHNS